MSFGNWYDVAAVAARIGRSERTVRRWIARTPKLKAAARHVLGTYWLPEAALCEVFDQAPGWCESSRPLPRPAPRVFSVDGVPARTEGELRRRLEAGA